MLTEGPTEREIEVVGEHFRYLLDLTNRDVMILVGRTQEDNEDTFGLAIFETESEATAQAIMQNDPAVLQGVMSAKLHPFGIALQRM